MRSFLDWLTQNLVTEMARMNSSDPWMLRGKNEDGEFEGGYVEGGKSVRQVLSEHPEGIDLESLINFLGGSEIISGMSPVARANALKSLRAQITRWVDKGMIRRETRNRKTYYFLGAGRSLDKVLKHQGLTPEGDSDSYERDTDSPDYLQDLIDRLYLHWSRYLKDLQMGAYKQAGDFEDSLVEAMRKTKLNTSTFGKMLRGQKDKRFQWYIMNVLGTMLGDIYSQDEISTVLASALDNAWSEKFGRPVMERIFTLKPFLIASTLAHLPRGSQNALFQTLFVPAAKKALAEAGPRRDFLLNQFENSLSKADESTRRRFFSELGEEEGMEEEL